MPPAEVTRQSKKLGALVHNARSAKGVSLRTLADGVGVNFSLISYIEAGRVHRPEVRTLQRLSRALDIPLDQLYSLAGYNRPEGLPELRDYLKLKYRLSERAIDEIENRFEQVQHGEGAVV